MMQEYHYQYNFSSHRRLTKLQVEQTAFKSHLTIADGGLGRLGHFWNMTRMQWPDLKINPWLEDQVRAYCDPATARMTSGTFVKTVSLTGCAAAGKSFSAALFALCWWRVSPAVSTVIICSTTKEMMRRRIWDVIADLHTSAVNPYTGELDPRGRLIESRTKIVWEDNLRSDEKHGIFGIAVAEGETTKAVQHIKGTHAQRILVIADEAEATPEAIFAAIPNLRKGCLEFILIAIGNSVSKIDPHGTLCEPVNGWRSITVENTSWHTKGVDKWQVEPGVCLHFDGTKSPNVLAGRTIYPYLYSWEDHQAAIRRPDYTLTMAYWQHDRGFWPPEGLSDRIFTESMIEKYDGTGGFQFLSRSTPVAFLDPAFGGDECKLVFGRLGDIGQGHNGLLITESLVVPITAESPHEVDYQIARRAIEECKARGVAPRQFGCDAVGTGRGVHAILAGEWSPEIQRVETTALPTERPASTADGRPEREVYDRVATGMWWAAREALQAGQLKGLYREAISQMCTRRFEQEGRKYRIETKIEYKARLGRSPDDADCVIGLLEVARRNGFAIASSAVQRTDREWTKLVNQANGLVADSPVEQDYGQAEFDMADALNA